MRLLFSMSMVVAACSLAGCSSSDDAMPEEKEGHVIRIAPCTEDGVTKGAPILEAAGLTEMQVCARRSDTQQLYFTDVSQKDNTSGLLLFSSPHYWINGTSLDLYAITPSKCISDITYQGEISFNYNGSADGEGDDIMTGCAYGQTFTNENQGIVSLNVQHTLSMIEFAVGYDIVDGTKVAKIRDNVIITSLGLRNVAITGHCRTNGLTISWKADNPVDGVTQDLTQGGTTEGLRVGTDIKAGDVINLSDHSKAFYLIPNQVLTTLQVSYKGVDSNSYTKEIDIKPILLVAGRHYIFNLAIGT